MNVGRVRKIGERPDGHNVEVDQSLAERGYCGLVHLPSGRRCLLPAHHPDSCVFEALGIAPDEPRRG